MEKSSRVSLFLSQTQALGYFLTYPRCDLEPSLALELLRSCHKTLIKDFCVAQEAHKDGFPHLHAFIRYEKRVDFNPKLWDIAGHHGNYQPAKSWQAVLGYCKKGGNFIANIDTESAKSKKAARNLELLTEQPKQLIDSGSIGVFQLSSLIKARASYTLLYDAITTDDVRGVWVTGLSGAGKSHFVRSRHPANELFLKSQNKWWDGYSGESFVLLDDFDHQGVCLSHYLKIWADRWGCSGEIKGATINLRHTTFYVTSQYTVDELWPGNEFEEVREAISRRFQFIRITRPFIIEADELRDN